MNFFFSFQAKKGPELTQKKIFFQPLVPTWDALTLSTLRSVPKVHVRKNRCAIVNLLPLGARSNPTQATVGMLLRVIPGQRFFGFCRWHR